ncbi:YbaB/EbfC family nucleoid-associated protein [Actinosynnema mirum]|uniref:YbaB/EbfC DNA-binding family protein n=1 Tax=Actinosynnema mirum (strain ATCC 29888 / DSM 43827 / JCM 3225 / NBRC 14064 / NCIMB 13271 / NRRL B-12336 / IMRU 3971 / 101) TaxID=446462 RepID=C6WAQ6_ACTMD|nr:YbaB/EbfC family nucleoid-associated protein [Actinosynnema mirum]ACU37375.1 hypothetical protein Amir_3481 [Actinosynnema mirum DSM 43827]
MNAEQWLADYRRELAGAADGAARAGALLRQVGGHATSPRGEVEAWVGAGGALARLRLSAHARALEPDVLADLVVATAEAARASAAGRIAEIMTGFVGEGAALDAVREHQPAAVRRRDEQDDEDYYANPGVRA